jgi:hypothetical protein
MSPSPRACFALHLFSRFFVAFSHHQAVSLFMSTFLFYLFPFLVVVTSRLLACLIYFFVYKYNFESNYDFRFCTSLHRYFQGHTIHRGKPSRSSPHVRSHLGPFLAHVRF